MAPTTTAAAPGLTLWAESAADLMMTNPMSIRANATVRETIEMLTEHGFSAAPVIDKVGRAVGVVSRADILVHDREKGKNAGSASYYEQADLTTRAGERLGVGFHIQAKVVEQMVALKVHRLYVVEPDGTLVGVISAQDVLRHLRPAV